MSHLRAGMVSTAGGQIMSRTSPSPTLQN